MQAPAAGALGGLATLSKGGKGRGVLSVTPMRRGSVVPLLAVLLQAKLDGARWQVVPAYYAAMLSSAVGVAGARIPRLVRRLAAAATGAATVTRCVPFPSLPRTEGVPRDTPPPSTRSTSTPHRPECSTILHRSPSLP